MANFCSIARAREAITWARNSFKCEYYKKKFAMSCLGLRVGHVVCCFNMKQVVTVI